MKLPSSTLAFGLFLVAAGSVRTQVIEDWTVRYDGQTSARDFAAAVTADAQGNIFVSGNSSPSFGLVPPSAAVTVKLDPRGESVWRASFEGVARAIAPDGQGGAYVTGGFEESWQFQYMRDFFLVRYGPTGQELWSRRLGEGQGVDLAVDSTGGVWVTGMVAPNPVDSDPDYLTARFDPQGNEVWRAHYQGPPRTEDSNCDDEDCIDEAAAIALDCLGNAYVTGRSQGTGVDFRRDFDFATIKYDPAGTEVWVARHDGPGAFDDSPAGIAIDSAGNIHVAGSSYSAAGNQDFATVKYDSSGKLLWMREYDGPAGGHDLATAIEISPAGEAHVAGLLAVPGQRIENAALKYSPDGDLLWEVRFPGLSLESSLGYYPVEIKTSLALQGAACAPPPAGPAGAEGDGNDGAVHVTGVVENPTSGFDYRTVKYDGEGRELWRKDFDASGREDIPAAVTLDRDSSVIVAGSSTGAGTGSDHATLKYSSLGDLLWESRYDGPGIADEALMDLVADSSGNVHATGSSSTADGWLDAVTIKYGPDGSRLWLARYDGAAHGYDVGEALAVDGAGHVYVAVTSQTMNSQGMGFDQDILLLEYDSEGRLLRESPLDHPGQDRALEVVLHPSGVYVGGEGRTADLALGFLAVKYDFSGQVLWWALAEGFSRVADIAVDGSGNICATGLTYHRDSPEAYYTRDVCTVKVDSSGKVAWRVRYDGPAEDTGDEGWAISVDRSGNIYVAASSGVDFSSAGTPGRRLIVIKYDPDGNEIWLSSYESPSGDLLAAADMVLDEEPARGGIYVAGSSFRASDRQADFLALKCDFQGSEIWRDVRNAQEESDDVASDIALDEDGNIHVAGTSRRGSQPDSSHVLAVYDPTGRRLEPARLQGPAPFSGFTTPRFTLGPGGALFSGGTPWSLESLGDFSIRKLHLETPLPWLPPDEHASFRRGDANADGDENLSDAIFVLRYLFLGGPAPACEKSADSDDGGVVDISDAVYLLNHLFLGGPPPQAPLPDCGSDATVDALTCKSHAPCR